MRSKKSIGKGASIVLAASLIGMGTAPSIPKAFADTTVNTAAADSSDAANTNTPVAVGTNTLSQLEVVKPDKTTADIDLSSGVYQYSTNADNSVQSITLLLKETNVSGPITKVTEQNATNVTPVEVTLNPGDAPGEYTTAVILLDTGDNTIVITVSDGTNLADYSLKITRQSAGSSTGTSSGGSSSTGTSSTGTSKTGTSSGGSSSKRGTHTGSNSGTHAGSNYTGAHTGSNTGSTKYGSRGISGFNKTGASMKNGGGASWGQGSQQGGAMIQKPSTATLSSLTVSAGTWNKTFAKDTYTYHIAVASNVNQVTLKDATTYSGASVTINGSTSNAINIGNQSKTIIPVVVTNGSDRKTYVLVFDKTIPQTSTTTAASTASDNSSAAVETTTTPLNNNSDPYTPGAWNNQNNNTSASWWSRLINSIRSFFSNL